MTASALWPRVLAEMPLVAILRGITPAESLDVAAALERSGFLCLEIPLNSPDALTSIRKIQAQFGEKLLVGAGTVLTPADVDAVHQVGAAFVVSPNTNAEVIRATKARGLLSIPGFLTPTEAFAALDAGADALKLFPAEAAPPAVLRALKAVLPVPCPVFAVGGISPESMRAYCAAGAAGFGIGSMLYKGGGPASAVADSAQAFVKAWHALGRPR